MHDHVKKSTKFHFVLQKKLDATLPTHLILSPPMLILSWHSGPGHYNQSYTKAHY
jgi:hypothetical protein